MSEMSQLLSEEEIVKLSNKYGKVYIVNIRNEKVSLAFRYPRESEYRLPPISTPKPRARTASCKACT